MKLIELDQNKVLWWALWWWLLGLISNSLLPIKHSEILEESLWAWEKKTKAIKLNCICYLVCFLYSMKIIYV
jgi:hypothetical protein